MFRTWGIFAILSNIYDVAFFKEPCVSLAYLEPWYIQNLRKNKYPVKHLYDVVFSLWKLAYIQNPDIFWNRGIQNPVKYIWWSILFRTLKYSIFRLLIHSKPSDIWNSRHSKYWESLKYCLRRTICNLGIYTTLVYSSPGTLRAQWIIWNLSNMCDGLFSTELCVTLVFSELEAYSEPCEIFMMENFIHNLIWPQHI